MNRAVGYSSPKANTRSNRAQTTHNPQPTVPTNIPSTNLSSNNQQNQQQLKMTIVNINNETREVSLLPTMTIQQVKQYIFDNISKSLDIDSMSLSYEGTILRNNLKLSEVRIVTGTQLKIRQTKLEIG